MTHKPVSPILTGLLFAISWASASVAGKFGLFSVEPLVLFNIRFLGAGGILLAYVYLVERSRLPSGAEWKQLTLFGAFNTTLYLGIFVFALHFISPGITTLAIALNPLFISIFSALWMKRKVLAREWLSIALGIGGVIVASYPLLKTSHASPTGMILLGFSMIAYSLGAVYYASVNWKLSRTSINAWQVLIGGLLLIPFTVVMHEKENHFDLRFWLSLAWLIFPVSILAVQLWLRLLKSDAVKASLWLYLCPVFGFLYAAILLGEPITLYTLFGTALVMTALYIGQRKKV
ncbi:EamA family transporter [Fulvivirgaceae bacterium PWU4]|uniref:EamA family transporter n=1 Tax=Chryseosolibacter histidini TaxID=2782349 RepID=A0AAP2DQG3_9BACT|nr:EamA family transporter [Chryseosolibacter histidini]MBT1700610.1 EamA family transporter [Chryseosolibacter histidini]